MPCFHTNTNPPYDDEDNDLVTHYQGQEQEQEHQNPPPFPPPLPSGTWQFGTWSLPLPLPLPLSTPTPIKPEPEIVLMDGISVGLDPEHQIIILQMYTADPTVSVIPRLQLNLLGAVQLMQMLRSQVRMIEKLPPLSS